MNKPTLMIVDDEAINVQMMSGILSRNGYTIRPFVDPIKAFDNLLNHPGVELILLDIHMPRLNGCEFYAKMLEHDATASIPVIFITGHNKAEAETLCKRSDLQTLEKPVDLNEARAMIDVLLRRA